MIFWSTVPPASTASVLGRPQVLRFCAQICYSSRSPSHGSHGKPTSAPHGIFVRDSSASVVSSCVRSVILTDERFLHFQLRQDTVTFKITIEATSPEGSPQAAQTGRDAHIGVAQDGGTVRKVVGRAGIEPATLSLEGRWDPFLPITVVVYGLCKHCIHAPSSMASECCRLLRFSARGPRYFPRYSLCRLSRRVGFREQFAL